MNIVLIGLMGSGKTTIGKIVADKLNFEFYDSDEEIEEHAHKSINKIFEEDGEEKFRQIESEVIKELSKKESCVLSLGGGAILREENMANLKPNSKIVFLNRPVENIVSDVEVAQRPLLKNGIEVLYSMYDNRIDLYKKYADIEIVNNRGIQEIVNEIISEGES